LRSITVNINDVDCKLNWINIPELIKYASLQICPFNTDEDIFLKDYENAQKGFVDKILNFIPDLDKTKVKKIISVGSGIGTTELLLLQYFNNAEIFLIDKEEISRPELIPDGELTAEVYRDRSNPRGFYNSWDVTKDAIQSSNLDQTKIHFLNPDDIWPDNVDLIISNFSWCWAYLKEVYWERALRSLNMGGALLLDIYRLPDQDVEKEISDELGSQPLKIKYFNTKTHIFKGIRDKNGTAEDYFVKFFNPDQNGNYGGTYSWIRRK
jgi:SAM-dependent methyltransferase